MKRSSKNLISMTVAASMIFPAGNLTCGFVSAQSRYDSRFENYPVYSGDDLELSLIHI